MQSGRFEFRRGPIFTNLLLADEINRTPPKAQAALLEAMAERQVSIDRMTHPLPAPFIVLATDNPIEYEGTYPLPEAQLDRFAIKLELRYLSEQEEKAMLRRRLQRGWAEPRLHQIVDQQELLAMQESVEQVTVHDDVLEYVVSLATATRQHPQIAVGASPRAELDLVQLARAHALLRGRDYVIPEDVKSLAVPTMAHRISLRPEMWVRRIQAGDVLAELLHRMPVPHAEVLGERKPRDRGCARVGRFAFDARGGGLRGSGLGRSGFRIPLAADRFRGPATGRVVLDQLAAGEADGATPQRSGSAILF